MKLVVDRERARRAVRRLHETLPGELSETIDIDTATYVPPEGIEWNSKKHFLYLFYGCLLDYGMKSSLYHENLRNTFEERPELFEPEYVVRNFQENVERLAMLLKKSVRLRFPNEGARRWLSLSEILLERYQGNPKEIFEQPMKFDEVKEAVLGIKGFGQKTGGLLIRILYENDLIRVEGQLTHIPIDRHDIEISRMIGVLTTEESNWSSSVVLELLSSAWVEASYSEEIDPCETDRNLWIVGSTMCSKKKCSKCPLNDMCEKSEGEVCG
ncbi:MAG: hypothetical protein HXS44_10810 [Theionarchaea archaeon]|nr:hypothetical protein [Theionarchaea archaeon]